MLRLIVPICLFALALAGCQTGQSSFQSISLREGILKRSMIVPNGQPNLLEFVSTLNPDCSPIEPMFTVRVTTRPAHGRFSAVPGTGFPRLAPCRMQRVSGIRLMYQSDAGWTGDDFVAFDIFATEGSLLHVEIVIHVK